MFDVPAITMYIYIYILEYCRQLMLWVNASLSHPLCRFYVEYMFIHHNLISWIFKQMTNGSQNRKWLGQNLLSILSAMVSRGIRSCTYILYIYIYTIPSIWEYENHPTINLSASQNVGDSTHIPGFHGAYIWHVTFLHLLVAPELGYKWCLATETKNGAESIACSETTNEPRRLG